VDKYLKDQRAKLFIANDEGRFGLFPVCLSASVFSSVLDRDYLPQSAVQITFGSPPSMSFVSSGNRGVFVRSEQEYLGTGH
jgi:roadblock/LC7 domain-containing protein